MATLSPAASLGLDELAAFARAAEAAGFDLLALDCEPGFEALPAAAALIGRTTRIGLCAAAHTGVGEPFTLGRGLSALDHLSGGRAAWRILPEAPEGLPAYAHRTMTAAGQQAERALEFVRAARGLWNGWAPDALLHDKAEARFSDPSRVRRVDHDGPIFHVRGPLNTPRSPQGRPVLVCDGTAPDALIAQFADLVVSKAASAVALAADVARIRALAGPRAVRVLASPEVADPKTCDGVHATLSAGDADRLAEISGRWGGAPNGAGPLRTRFSLLEETW